MPRQVHIVSRVSYDNIGEMTSLLLRHLFLRTCQSTRHRHFKTVDLFVSKETLLNSFFSWFYNILTQVHSANKWLVNVILLFLCYSFNREKKTFIFLFTVKHLTRVKRQTFCFFFLFGLLLAKSFYHPHAHVLSLKDFFSFGWKGEFASLHSGVRTPLDDRQSLRPHIFSS